MKQQSKWLATAMASLIIAGSAQAQGITGTPYLSNINPADTSTTGQWPTATLTSTPTGLEIAAPGGSGSFSTLYYAIPVEQQTPLDSADTQVTFDFTFNSPAGPYVGGVAVIFALDDSMGGTVYYSTGYGNSYTAGSYSVTYDLTGDNLSNVGAGALINGMNLQMDPPNIGGPYDITFNSITLHPVPEPASLALAGLGMAGLLVFRRRK